STRRVDGGEQSTAVRVLRVLAERAQRVLMGGRRIATSQGGASEASPRARAQNRRRGGRRIEHLMEVPLGLAYGLCRARGRSVGSGAGALRGGRSARPPARLPRDLGEHKLPQRNIILRTDSVALRRSRVALRRSRVALRRSRVALRRSRVTLRLQLRRWR